MPVTRSQATINGKPLTFETGKYAKQAGGAVTVRYGDTVVFAAATVARTIQQMEESTLDLIVAGTRDSIMMMEAGARQVSEDFLIQAVGLAQEGIRKICDAQMELQAASGKPKLEYIHVVPDPARLGAVTSFLSQRLRAKLRNPDKAQREAGLDELKLEAVAQFATGETAPLTLEEVSAVYEQLLEEEFRKAVTEENLRPDGRGTKDIRQLSIEVGALPRTHGSAVFTRGQTQVLSVATLGPGGDEQIIDTLSPVDTKRYMHHYNFPPFSVGEVRMMRGAGRREIGHGALAERAILPVLPTKEEFPYTIRVVSGTLESNGSSSMASTCGSTLALMDAGVPIKEMIGGIAMGLVTSGDKYTILTDIQGLEDHYGDMDLKVTGSAKGVTALQMDLKVKGISADVLGQAFQQAKEARLFILDAMRKVIDRPRSELSKYAPRIETIKIHPDKIREVIGPGGKMIRSIQSETGTAIELEDDGTVRITGAKADGRERGKAMIMGMTKEPEVGEVYDGKVTRIMSIGAFVEYLPGKEGLVRVSELSPERVNRVEDVVNIGDAVKVKIAEVDRQGRVNLSIRAVSEENGNSYEERQRAERSRYQDREGGDRGGGFRRGPGGGGGGGFRRGGPPRG